MARGQERGQILASVQDLSFLLGSLKVEEESLVLF